MATHQLTIQDLPKCPTFYYIKKGRKTVEGRSYKEKYHGYQKGDQIIFICGGESISTSITDIKLYKTLEEYVEKEGYQNVLPGIGSREEAIKMYNDQGWSLANEREEMMQKYGFGFMGIHIKL